MKLFLAVPVYGAMDANFAQCLIHLMVKPPCEILLGINAGDSLVSRSRNTLTANFLASDCTHLMFADSDLIFSPEHVARLMKHNEKVVAGFYPKKDQGPIQWCCNALPGNPPPRPDGLQPVRFMGTGFMRVHRTVFEKMISRYDCDIRYKSDTTGRDEWDFWTVGVHAYPDGSRRYLSEDWFFCQRWLDLGGTVWGDTRICLKHVGIAAYPLKSQEPEIVDSAPSVP